VRQKFPWVKHRKNGGKPGLESTGAGDPNNLSLGESEEVKGRRFWGVRPVKGLGKGRAFRGPA